MLPPRTFYIDSIYLRMQIWSQYVIITISEWYDQNDSFAFLRESSLGSLLLSVGFNNE